jgi:hypothetical protein
MHALLLLLSRDAERVLAPRRKGRGRPLGVAVLTAAAGGAVAAMLAVAAPSGGGFATHASSDGPAASSAAPRRSEASVDQSPSLAPALVRARDVRTRRAFVWAAVPRTDSYQFELFRGRELVFRARVAALRLVLPAQWHFAGRLQSLGAGSYRWYVWPVPAGRARPAEKASVQARFEVTG